VILRGAVKRGVRAEDASTTGSAMRKDTNFFGCDQIDNIAVRVPLEGPASWLESFNAVSNPRMCSMPYTQKSSDCEPLEASLKTKCPYSQRQVE
jgi:hypothetical protein